MAKQRKVRWLVLKISLGLIALALLWLPLAQDVTMAFSGPVRICRHYGAFSYFSVDTHYKPFRMGLKLAGTTCDVSQLMKEGNTIWSQDDSEVILVRVTDQFSTLSGSPLAATIALTAMVVWFAMIRPVRKHLRTGQAFSLQVESGVDSMGDWPTAGLALQPDGKP
jgi:hypothetical protein